MHYAGAQIGLKAGVFYGIVQVPAFAYFFESKFRVRFVARHQGNPSYPQETVQDIPAQFQVHHAEHIDIVHFPVENSPAPFDSVSRDFVIGHFKIENLDKKPQDNSRTKHPAGNHPVMCDFYERYSSESYTKVAVDHFFEWELYREDDDSQKNSRFDKHRYHSEK